MMCSRQDWPGHAKECFTWAKYRGVLKESQGDAKAVPETVKPLKAERKSAATRSANKLSTNTDDPTRRRRQTERPRKARALFYCVFLRFLPIDV